MKLGWRKLGVLFSYILMVVEILSGLLFTPFIIRSLGQAEYGIYSLSLTITAYVMLLDMGVGNAIVKYFSKFRVNNDIYNQKKFFGLSMIFYIFIAILIMILFHLFNSNISQIFAMSLSQEEIELASILLRITFLNAAFTLFFSVFDKLIISYEFFAVSKIIGIFRIVARVLLQIILLMAGFGSIGIVLANLAFTIIAGLVCMNFVVFKLKIRPMFKQLNLNFIKEIASYSFFVFVQMVATQINGMADQVILGIMTSSVVLGVYAVGSQITQYFQSFAVGINGVIMPGLVKIVENNANASDIEDEMIKIGRFSFIFLGFIFGIFIALGDEFVVLWAGEQNDFAYVVAAIIMTPLTFSLIQSPGTQLLWAKGKHKVQAYIKIAVASVNIAVTIILVKWNPLIGAAIGTAIACFLGDIVAMNIVFRKYLGLKMSRYYYRLLTKLLLCICVSSVVAYFVKLFLPIGWIYFFVEVFVAVCIYVVLLVVFGLNSYEKIFFLEIFKKLKNVLPFFHENY